MITGGVALWSIGASVQSAEMYTAIQIPTLKTAILIQ